MPDPTATSVAAPESPVTDEGVTDAPTGGRTRSEARITPFRVVLVLVVVEVLVGGCNATDTLLGQAMPSVFS